MKRWIAAACFAVLATSAFSQQIIKVAVVNFDKVKAAFETESPELKAYNEKKAKIVAEIEKMKGEIKTLNSQKAEAEKKLGAATDETQKKAASDELERLNAEYKKKLGALNEYVAVKQAELDADAKKLMSGEDMIQKIYRGIQLVAEMEGYMVVLNSSQAATTIGGDILWYSSVVDLTDKVVLYLQGKYKVVK